MKNSAIVAIIGRPNVGKSTLFNRLIKNRLSIVDDTVGVTRDRIYQKAQWLNREFWLVDTGGLGFGNDELQEQILLQAQIAIEQADVIIFTTNYQERLQDEEKQIAKMLYGINKPVILVVNKYDNQQVNNELYEFIQLGFGEPIAVSSTHGIGIGDLLDKIIFSLNQLNLEIKPDLENETKMAIIGRPNVGKSSLTNALLNESRVVVSNVPGTTTDAVDSSFVRNGQKFVVIDTAGIRKRGKVQTNLEKYSVLRALKAVERSDIVLLVLDGKEGIREQDAKIGAIAKEGYKPVIIVVNKYDEMEKTKKTLDDFRKEIQVHFKYLHYAFVIFVSALKNVHLAKIFQNINKIQEKQNLRIQTSVVNEILSKAQLLHQPPIFQGERLKIYYATQVSKQPITFVLFVNNPKHLHFSYARFLENQLREYFDFQGIPLRLIFRQRK